MTWFRVAVLRCPLDNIIQIQSGAWVGWPMSCGGRLLRTLALVCSNPFYFRSAQELMARGILGFDCAHG